MDLDEDPLVTAPQNRVRRILPCATLRFGLVRKHSESYKSHHSCDSHVQYQQWSYGADPEENVFFNQKYAPSQSKTTKQIA